MTVRKKTPIEVNVFGLIARRADYALYAYAWDAPTIPNMPGGPTETCLLDSELERWEWIDNRPCALND